MGVVYAAYDDLLDRKVAVKVLLGETVRDVTLSRVRLLREAQAMARLSHSQRRHGPRGRPGRPARCSWRWSSSAA